MNRNSGWGWGGGDKNAGWKISQSLISVGDFYSGLESRS